MSADVITTGRTALGIELGSTRIKACLVDADDPTEVLAVGSHAWENRFVERTWTYALDDVWDGVRSAYADLVADAQRRHGVALETVGAIGVSAMMHGYLAFDGEGELLTPFRTWRNTTTGPAAEALSTAFDQNIPLRWSVAHLFQAVLDGEPHVPEIRFLTTLAGYVHEQLTGQRVVGVGDASGMFPIDPATRDYDLGLIETFDRMVAEAAPGLRIAALLPRVLKAGEPAGALTEEGAARLDPTGRLRPGIPFCPPEGDAGTGMVATNAVAPRTGNVSAGTSIFAMVVLEGALAAAHHEIDIVTTPAGDPVAMVHCNNGASELAEWAGMFGDFTERAGSPLSSDEVFEVLLRAAEQGDPDAGGLIAFNQLSGEPIVGLEEGRPLFVRTPDSRFTLPNAIRAQLYGMFATLALGMRVLSDEGVAIDRMFAHGGVFRTAGVAQRFLAAAIGTPVAVGDTAGEGGPWGMAVLAAHLLHAEGSTLSDYLDRHVFADAKAVTVDPQPDDVAGFARFLGRYEAALAVERAAVAAL
ncbi:sugar (pentulose or hexulose) kinase [Microbacterium sp. SLBN-154]|uniref:xylulokinase n=1 Tax=Microbacterium sp. SLBN-154 TaxID=2768458 RepID=UPI00114EF8E4|nr:FGGY-family carbohydrate kinase [Microbacterium sp. SLBN-154]TQK20634.1 sugar (pentulose or hexulose) kinase [Microbacterium sp. SLBN-154]